jgi:hypothetical protein
MEPLTLFDMPEADKKKVTGKGPDYMRQVHGAVPPGCNCGLCRHHTEGTVTKRVVASDPVVVPVFGCAHYRSGTSRKWGPETPGCGLWEAKEVANG